MVWGAGNFKKVFFFLLRTQIMHAHYWENQTWPKCVWPGCSKSPKRATASYLASALGPRSALKCNPRKPGPVGYTSLSDTAWLKMFWEGEGRRFTSHTTWQHFHSNLCKHLCSARISPLNISLLSPFLFFLPCLSGFVLSHNLNSPSIFRTTHFWFSTCLSHSKRQRLKKTQ